MLGSIVLSICLDLSLSLPRAIDLVVDLLLVVLLGSMVLSISVLDINDNAPEFEQTEYVTSLNETSPTGTYVLQVNFVCDRETER